jgi:acyl-CoA reductase-like NAD-dependent aldehyde dehydrogenase
MYIFSQDKGTTSVIIENTSSGDVVVNDTILHVAGIFYKGYGPYHKRLF